MTRIEEETTRSELKGLRKKKPPKAKIEVSWSPARVNKLHKAIIKKMGVKK